MIINIDEIIKAYEKKHGPIENRWTLWRASCDKTR